MGAAKGAVDVDESGLRLHSLAQGDAVSAPGSTGAGAACGGLATTSGDRERLEDERPESVLLDSRSRPESGCSRPELERTESVLLDVRSCLFCTTARLTTTSSSSSCWTAGRGGA